jgi:Fe-S cluster assembly protein SufD
VSALDTARDHYVSRFETFSRALRGEPAWLGAVRSEAIGRFAENGLPTTRDEAWRHTSVAGIAKIPFELPAGAPAPVSRDELEEVAAPLFACSLFVFVDGHFAPQLSSPSAQAGGVSVESLAQLRSEAPERLESHFASVADLKRHPFAALNTAFVDDGAVLLVPESAAIEEPLHLVFLSSRRAGPQVRHPRVLLVAGRGSEVRVIQDHVSLGNAPSLQNSVTEVLVGENAGVELVLLQREGPGSMHLSNLAVQVERDGRFASHTLTLGGEFVRNDLEVALLGEGADCTLHGLFLGAGNQVVDNHTLVDHAVPRGTSRELYKGILGGSARGVFRGRIVVRPDAQKTNAYQSNPNLILTDGAEIDSQPQLEIHADDVKCSHGSSVGQLDGDTLFYIRSRGVPEPEARRILTHAFATEILRALPLAALSEGLDDFVTERLREIHS